MSIELIHQKFSEFKNQYTEEYEDYGEWDWPDAQERVSISQGDYGLHFHYHGLLRGEIAAFVADPTLAPLFQSVIIDGPDEGANGTIDINLHDMAKSTARFERLRYFQIQQTGAGNHNQVIIDRGMMDEEGVIAECVAKMPLLETLILPSAPDKSFFEIDLSRLIRLEIDAGYDRQNFIENMAAKNNMPRLVSFIWGEYHQTYIEEWQDETTPFEAMLRLFKNTHLSDSDVIGLKNPIYTETQLRELKQLKPSLQFKIIYSGNRYVYNV